MLSAFVRLKHNSPAHPPRNCAAQPYMEEESCKGLGCPYPNPYSVRIIAEPD
jgi:hypothetical protein